VEDENPEDDELDTMLEEDPPVDDVPAAAPPTNGGAVHWQTYEPYVLMHLVPSEHAFWTPSSHSFTSSNGRHI
jgi:hypothetical protein